MAAISHVRVQVLNGDRDVAHSCFDNFHAQESHAKASPSQSDKESDSKMGKDNMRFLAGYIHLIMLSMQNTSSLFIVRSCVWHFPFVMQRN